MHIGQFQHLISEKYGNPSAIHNLGQESRQAMDEARRGIAAVLGCLPLEVIFTSGATESNNLALKGIAGAYGSQGQHLITTAIEHKSILDPIQKLHKKKLLKDSL